MLVVVAVAAAYLLAMLGWQASSPSASSSITVVNRSARDHIANRLRVAVAVERKRIAGVSGGPCQGCHQVIPIASYIEVRLFRRAGLAPITFQVKVSSAHPLSRWLVVVVVTLFGELVVVAVTLFRELVVVEVSLFRKLVVVTVSLFRKLVVVALSLFRKLVVSRAHPLSRWLVVVEGSLFRKLVVGEVTLFRKLVVVAVTLFRKLGVGAVVLSAAV